MADYLDARPYDAPNLTAETADVATPSPNPAWPFLAIVGLMYLFIAPTLLLTNAPRASILSLSMLVFGVGTIYLASKPYNTLCRIMDGAWGSLMSLVCVCGLLVAYKNGSLQEAIAAGVALTIVSPVLVVAIVKQPNRVRIRRGLGPSMLICPLLITGLQQPAVRCLDDTRSTNGPRLAQNCS